MSNISYYKTHAKVTICGTYSTPRITLRDALILKYLKYISHPYKKNMKYFNKVNVLLERRAHFQYTSTLKPPL